MRWVLVHIDARTGGVYRAHQGGQWKTPPMNLSQAVEECMAQGGRTPGEAMVILGSAVCDLNTLGDVNGKGRWREFDHARAQRPHDE